MAETNIEYQYMTTKRPEPVSMKGYVEAESTYDNQCRKTYQVFEQHKTYQIFKQPEVVYLDHDIEGTIREMERVEDERTIRDIHRALFAGLVVLGFIADYRFINWLLSLIR